MTLFQDTSHRRFNPLTREWVLVSPHRTQRPWQGQVERPRGPPPAYDPECYLCPGNARAAARAIRTTRHVRLRKRLPRAAPERRRRDRRGGLLVAEPSRRLPRGLLLAAPRSDDRRMAAANPARSRCLDRAVSRSSARMTEINYVQIFENRGAMMGAAIRIRTARSGRPRACPTKPAKEQAAQRAYRAKHGRCCSAIISRSNWTPRRAHRLRKRTFRRAGAVLGGVAVRDAGPPAPPFRPGRDERRGARRSGRHTERADDPLRQPVRGLVPLHDGLPPAPTDGEAHPEWHFHAHFFPPLLRSATVRKFMVGYEMLATPQRDITPETAAARLRDSVGGALPRTGRGSRRARP